MPGFDRRGPLGEGPRTGRGFGKCGMPVGAEDPVSRGIVGGVGRGGSPRGGGRGRCLGGRGMRVRFMPVDDPQALSLTEELEALKAQLESAEAKVAAMKTRLEELEKNG